MKKKEFTILNTEGYVPRIGLDRVKVNNIQITHIENVEKLFERETVQRLGAYDYQIPQPHEKPKPVWSARIIDPDAPFTEFVFGHTPLGTSERGNYAWIDFSAGNVYGTNLYNLSATDCAMHLSVIKDYLKRVYGIDIDIVVAQYKYMEINVTLALDYEFDQYRRMLELITYCVPGTLKQVVVNGQKDKDIRWGTYCRYNKRMQLVLYDKTAELRNRQRCLAELDLLRIELKLLNPLKIREAFDKKSEVWDIWDVRDEDIIECFQENCIELMWDPIVRWTETSGKLILRTMKACKKASRAHWQTDFFEEMNRLSKEKSVPVLPDIEMVYDLIRNKDYKTTHSKRLIEEFAGKESRYSTYYQQDWKKLSEIFNKIDAVYIDNKKRQQVAEIQRILESIEMPEKREEW